MRRAARFGAGRPAPRSRVGRLDLAGTAGYVFGTNYGPAAIPRIFVGDVNGDGRADIISQLADGTLRITPSSGDLSTDHSVFKVPTRIFGAAGDWTSTAIPRVF